MALGLLPFGLFEAVCWWNRWGSESHQADPFIEYSARPHFELTADGERWQIASNRRRFFSDESFPATKPAGSRRVFVVGESTVAGEPFGKPTAFPTWLQLALDVVDANSQWNVINCGGVSYASYRLAPIVEECLTFEPDLIILAVGHNEFLEDRTYAPIRSTPPAIRSVYEFVEQSRGFRVARGWMLGPDIKSPLPDEVATRLDFEHGLESYHRDPVGRAAVVAHYEFNLRRTLASATAAGVPLLLLRQPSNLADCPPFKSEYDLKLSDSDRQRCETLIAEAREQLATDVRAAIALLELATRLDPTHARTQYELGRCYEAVGDRDRARAAYIAARDHDVCPLRMVSELEAALFRVAEESNTPLVDLHALLEEQTPTGILGGFLLVDHVHPSITGHQLIARRLLEEMGQRGWCRNDVHDPTLIDTAFAAHLAGLDEHYYLRGQRTLRSLQAWAAGRAALTPTVSEPDSSP